MPADVSPAALALRSGLHGTQKERDYALAALIHAGQTNQVVTLNAFLLNLASSSLVVRRQAMSRDISQAAVPLWTSDFLTQYPLPNWNGDNRLCWFSHHTIVNSARQTPGQEQQWRTATSKARAQMLAALVSPAAAPDRVLSHDAAVSLEQLADWTYNGLGWSIQPNLAYDTKLAMEQALAQAAGSLQVADPSLAKRLQELHDKLSRGPGAVL